MTYYSVLFPPFIVCIGCIRGTRCCGEAWGRCICRRPHFESCCSRISDPTCEAANAACNALRATARAALRVVEETVRGARGSVDVADGVLVAAQGVVNTARGALDAAVAVLEVASQTYRLGTEAATAIASVGVSGLVSIRAISFDVSLGAANSGSFSGSVRANFLGQAEVNIGLEINMRDITAMARELANQIGDGLSSLF